MDTRFLAVAGGLLALLIAAWVALPMLEQSTMKDPYSAACPGGMYLVEDKCVQLSSCTTDDDCWYLEKETLPPRVGKCVDSLCRAFCGSGRVFECVN
jgi:hypothetical protein